MTKQVTKRKVGRYSDAIKEQAAIEYAVCGSLRQVSKSMGINENTVQSWKFNGIMDETITRVQEEKASEHRAQYSKIIDTAQAKTLELIPKMTDAKAAMIIAATATDKVRLADNMPTTIQGKDTNSNIISFLESIAKTYDEKQANVVAVQDKVSD